MGKYLRMITNLYELSTWSQNLQMKFNVNICKITHFGGKKNVNTGCLVNHLELQEEKDLGVSTSNGLKSFMESAAIAVAQNANRLMGFLARNFHYKTPETITDPV